MWIQAGVRLEDERCFVRRVGGTVRPVCDESSMDVGRGQQPVLERQRVSGERAVIARPVDTLVVRRREPREGRERVAPGQDPVGRIGMKPHALPFGRRERTLLVPDPVLHGDAADVVQEPGAVQLLAGAIVESRMTTGLLRQARRPHGNGRGSTAT